MFGTKRENIEKVIEGNSLPVNCRNAQTSSLGYVECRKKETEANPIQGTDWSPMGYQFPR